MKKLLVSLVVIFLVVGCCKKHKEAERKAEQQRIAEQKAAEKREAEKKAAELKLAQQKAAELKLAQQKKTMQTYIKNKPRWSSMSSGCQEFLYYTENGLYTDASKTLELPGTKSKLAQGHYSMFKDVISLFLKAYTCIQQNKKDEAMKISEQIKRKRCCRYGNILDPAVLNLQKRINAK